ncbi:MAG: ABC transporter permease [Armatimonadetes bacterium]|nr:ABC transporter permease [Armatimonadota bacterium]
MKGLTWKHGLLTVGAFVLVWIAVQSTGVAPGLALKSFVEGSVGGPAAWRQTLREMTPLLVTGTAVFLALRAGLFNIGADGQLVVGACTATAVAMRVPGLAGIVAGCAAAVVAGAVWASPAAWIKAYKGGHEVISTIMLNNIAGFLTVWLVTGPMKDPSQQSPTTKLIDKGSFIPSVVDQPPFRMNLALIMGLIVVALLAVFLKKTVSGFEVAATGANPTAAKAAGVDVRRVTVWAMAVSGGLAGLAGAFLSLGFEHRFYADFSPGYGFDGLGVALLAGGSPWGLVPASFLFAVISAGTSSVDLLGVPKGMNGILLGLIIIVFATVRYRRAGVAVD